MSKWPINIQPLVPLWKHQAEGVQAACFPEPRSFAFFFSVGVGKTCTLINVLRHIYAYHGALQNTLILAPIAVLRNWERELGMHSKVAKNATVLVGSTVSRIKKIKEATEPKIFITNYDALVNKDFTQAVLDWGPVVMVCDESQRLKSIQAARTKAAIKIADRATYKYLLSGTPITNSPMDIFSQYRILDGGKSFGDNFFVFRNTWFYDTNAGMPSHKHFPNWRPRPGIEKGFNELIYKKAMRAVKSECLDLPPFVRTTREVALSPEQKRLYESMRKDWVAYVEDRAFVASIALTKALRMQQIVTGFCTDDTGNVLKIEENPRLAILSELLEDLAEQSKIIIWACFQQNYADIKKVCEKLKLDYRTMIGGMTDKERTTALHDFDNDTNVRVMIANQGAGGVGVNMIASDVSIYYSRTYSLEQDLQSEARNYRGGSERHNKVTRIDLVTPDTIDEVVLRALAGKQDAAEAILKWRGV